MFNLDFIIAGFFVILMVVILFFSKKRLESKETRLYGCMIVCSLVNVIINIVELSIGYLCYNDLTVIFLKLLNKIVYYNHILFINFFQPLYTFCCKFEWIIFLPFFLKYYKFCQKNFLYEIWFPYLALKSFF